PVFFKENTGPLLRFFHAIAALNTGAEQMSELEVSGKIMGKFLKSAKPAIRTEKLIYKLYEVGIDIWQEHHGFRNVAAIHFPCDFGEKPRFNNCPPANHQPVSAADPQAILGVLDGEYSAVGDNGNPQPFLYPGDPLPS